MERRFITIMTTPLLWILALAAGTLIPVQAAANAALSKSIHGNVPFAALTLFVVAGATTVAAVLLSGGGFPSIGELRAAPIWSYVGGLIVAAYVLTITFLVSRLGVGTAIALIVTGQITAALTIDQFGLFRALTVPLTPLRLCGGVLMATGVILALRR